MAEDKRRSAEIRRMASQKVAAELTRYSDYESVAKAREDFINTVDWLDADVVSAGDRAETPPKASHPPTPASTPGNGAEAVSGDATGAEKLDERQSLKMEKLLAELDSETLKLKLWDMKIPMRSDGGLSKEEAIREVIAAMNKYQAKQMVAWMKETK